MNTEHKFNSFLDRTLLDMSNNALPFEKADSVPIEYKLNSKGYRCDEFNNQEIITLGCSYTEGHGLPVELTWPYLISKKMNKSYINLAKGGEGAQAQITKAFQFFEEFYKPKYIFAVFPLSRLEVPQLQIKTNNGSNSPIGKGIFSNKKIQKYSKFPHVIEEVLPVEFAIFYNILFIKIFIQYCSTNNIKLIWTFQHEEDFKIYDADKLPGYFEIFNNPIGDDCHLEFSDNKFFKYAADHDYWPPGHWGFHQQIHIAESVYTML